ncbi:hypothetical protein BH23GEM9_BH23GEM9_25940 [soil metagenome]
MNWRMRRQASPSSHHALEYPRPAHPPADFVTAAFWGASGSAWRGEVCPAGRVAGNAGPPFRGGAGGRRGALRTFFRICANSSRFRPLPSPPCKYTNCSVTSTYGFQCQLAPNLLYGQAQHGAVAAGTNRGDATAKVSDRCESSGRSSFSGSSLGRRSWVSPRQCRAARNGCPAGRQIKVGCADTYGTRQSPPGTPQTTRSIAWIGELTSLCAANSPLTERPTVPLGD